MTAHSPVEQPSPAKTGYPRALWIGFACYAAVLLAAILSTPLRVPEVLQLAASRNFHFSTFLGWISFAPDPAPLNYFVQLPFVVAGAHSRLAARLVSLLFALGSFYLFLRLVKRVPLQRPYLALAVFVLLPIHFQLAIVGRPFEQALFLLILATIWYFRLLANPSFRTAGIYALALTLCIYTAAYAYFPAIGYLLFLLRFVDRPQERRAMWFGLGATVVPVLLFLPYYFWAHPQASRDWFAAPPFLAHLSVTARTAQSLAAVAWAAYVLLALFILGILAAAWASFRNPAPVNAKRIRIFCLLGGVIGTLALARILIVFAGETFFLSQVLWAAPAMVILLFAGVEWVSRSKRFRWVTLAVAAIVIGVGAVADAEYLVYPSLASPPENLQALASAVMPELTNGSCVVFVSERFSKPLFLVFEPELEKRECMNFFSKRIILASHPYVQPDQQRDAESYFRGLSFVEIKRTRIGGGQIIVMQSR